MNRLVAQQFMKNFKNVQGFVQKRTSLNYGMDTYAKRAEEMQHAKGSGIKTWTKLCWFFAIPSVVLMSIYVYILEMEHMKHPRPKFVDYEHVYALKRPFPWGDGKHSLLHNPQVNPIGGVGYEVPDPNEHHHEKH